jgi:hypothetical protein
VDQPEHMTQLMIHLLREPLQQRIPATADPVSLTAETVNRGDPAAPSQVCLPEDIGQDRDEEIDIKKTQALRGFGQAKGINHLQ